MAGSITTAEIKSVLIIKNQEDIDITRNVFNINIDESVSSKLLAGMVTFNDEFKLFELFNFSGDETIKVVINDIISKRDKEFNFSYVTHTISSPMGADSQQITIQFIDTQYVNFIKEFSTSFNSKPISNFIKEFSSNVLGKELDICEQSEGDFTFAFPYQKFHYILSYLNQYLTSTEGFNNYFYFSTINGNIFSTIENLLKEPQGYYNFQEVQKNLAGAGLGINSFTDYDLEKVPNIRETLLEKQGSSKVQYYDYNTGKMVEKKTKYSDVVSDYSMLGRYSVFSKTIMDQDLYTYYSSTDNVKNDMMLKQGVLNNGSYMYSLELQGDFRRTCGTTAGVVFREKNIGNQTFEVSKTGIYFVPQVSHVFTKNNFVQKIYIAKNAMNYPTSEGQVETSDPIL